MSFLKLLADGVEVTIRATPRGGRDGLDGLASLSDGREVLKVRVRAAPEDGAATAAVCKVLAQAAGVAPSQVRLASGATARVKVFRMSGDAPALAAALTAAAAGKAKG
ncbi:DUF167 domain-containing protein [Xanthobacter dioxanivorans]|uniref:UPF0235 protein EZH22_13790 n=1 Tax=Xanthobacter dioxanivorans TaxID=2528964 RepID=A0A974PTK8_9HYPH|nr:DUF167 family protein [Xanthobacter dioxanivorans]QRG09231.1 DUF167 domain-containing protein [Xanthobacter dioxanivorans]